MAVMCDTCDGGSDRGCSTVEGGPSFAADACRANDDSSSLLEYVVVMTMASGFLSWTQMCKWRTSNE
uniref:Uncharacterized protein n=1 Tax=Hyaloperonospora arabidopsidis (strain Emoy2) TaxID=559515 RepID=M4C3F5_HYAAE